jgi:hypothetical protein
LGSKECHSDKLLDFRFVSYLLDLQEEAGSPEMLMGTEKKNPSNLKHYHNKSIFSQGIDEKRNSPKG